MLWRAAQERLQREARERLTELWVAFSDGYVAGNVATGKAKATGDITPGYARSDQPALRSPEQRDRALAVLGRRYGITVKGLA